MQRHLKSALTVIVAVLLLVSSALSVFALGNAGIKTVRVGFYRIEGYNVMDEHGHRSGYGYEVLQAMKVHSNWRYEYIGYNLGWSDMQQMILNDEIDMVITAVKTPEREEIFDFSSLPVSQSGACIMVKAGESPYVAGDYESYNGMRIGFIESSSQIAQAQIFAAEKGFTYTPVYYKTSDELENAILDGTQVDAIVTSNMRIISGTRRLELFAMQNVHAMVKKGNTQLLKEINFALEQIELYNPRLYDSLYSKYYSVDAGDSLFFTPAEKAFIDECLNSGEPLCVALEPNMSPYAFYDGDTPKGLLYDISSEILRRTGLKTEIIITESTEEYNALTFSGDVDLWLTAPFDYNKAEKLVYTLTTPYYTTDVSKVTRKSDKNVSSIAVVKGSMLEEDYLSNVVTDEKICTYENVEQCVRAVLNKECDATYLYTRTAQEVVYADETNRLTSVIMPNYSVSFSVAVRDSAESLLASIVEKASTSLSEDDIARIVLNYTEYPSQKITFSGIVYSNPLVIIIMVSILLVIIFLGIFIVFINRKRAIESEKNVLLQQALDSAKKANSAKSTFMSRMSHEIRTPLNAIIGYNSISGTVLTKATNEAEYRQAVMKALDCLSKSDIASKHLLTVINDVLDMSAVESGKIKIANEPFDFKGEISSLSLLFFAQARAKKIDFEVTFGTMTGEWFIGDQMRVAQILTNLLSNAVKFTPEGGNVRLSISETDTDDARAHIHFEVSDTGIGMDKNFLSEIWSPFEQADSSISRRFGGTGLGLSITKNLVDLMGGTIEVNSVVNEGTVFNVSLILERMEQPTKEENIYDFSSLNVLVVDDDRSTCDYLTLLLNHYGVKCAAVNSGSDAIIAIKNAMDKDDAFTLCIVDWCMPNMDGLETVSKIKELPGENIPVIIISAYDFSEIMPETKALGINRFMAKPLFRSTVFDMLVNTIGKSGVNVTPKHSQSHDFGGARVLLAEDNQMNMEIAESIMSSWNVTVDKAYNGVEAVKRFCSSPVGTYKAVFMDVHMPEMDGYSATQKIRASSHEEAATIPIIAMTADVFAEDVSEALAAGMNDHIGKPIDMGLLLSILDKYINKD